MRLGLEIARAAFTQTFGHFVVLMAATITTALLSLPLVALGVIFGIATQSHLGALLAVILLGVILPNPAAAGLQYLTGEIARRELVALSDFWTGLRRYFGRALLIWLLSSFGSAVILANIIVYTHLGGVFSLLRFPWFYALGFWIAMHVSVYPLLMTQEAFRPLQLYRNAYILAAAHPAATVILLGLWLLLLVAATMSGLIVVIGLALFAAMQQNALPILRRSLNATASRGSATSVAGHDG